MTIGSSTHPLLSCAQDLRSSLAQVADLDPLYMAPREKAAALLTMGQVLAAATALQARLLAAATDVSEETGAPDPAAWLAAETHGDYLALRRMLELGRNLDQAPLVADALAAGQIDVDKARIILRALELLPDSVPDDLRMEAEAALVSHAPEFSPKALSRLGRHLDAIVDPDHFEDAEGRALLREERSAWEKTSLSIAPRFDGTHRITGTVPDAVAHRLRTYVEAHSQPRKAAGDRCRADQRAGRAFCDLLERIDPAALPDHGGDTTAVMITIPLAELQSDLGAAALGGVDSDVRLSASEARRMACTAGLIPAVLGSQSQILDLGRSQRLFSPAQRKALRARHSVCQVDGCDVPSTWCDAHHEDPWSTGGRTDLKNALLVCGHHHRRLHDPAYAVERKGHRIRVHRRT